VGEKLLSNEDQGCLINEANIAIFWAIFLFSKNQEKIAIQLKKIMGPSSSDPVSSKIDFFVIFIDIGQERELRRRSSHLQGQERRKVKESSNPSQQNSSLD